MAEMKYLHKNAEPIKVSFPSNRQIFDSKNPTRSTTTPLMISAVNGISTSNSAQPAVSKNESKNFKQRLRKAILTQ